MTPRIQRQLTLAAGFILLLGSAVPARADYNFNFNSLSPSPTQSDQSSNPGGSNAIALYMDGVLGCAANNCVTVSGLNASGMPYLSGSTAGYGVAVDKTYTGDGHVVGPNGVSLTLGNSNGATSNSSATPGAYDSFISNTADPEGTNGPNQLSQGILITFSHGLTGTLSFDYEIFPDGMCAQLNSASCGGSPNMQGIYPNQPDLTFAVNGTTVQTFYGVAPGTNMVGASTPNGTSTHSPISGTVGTEMAPQLIGHWSGNVSGATSLSFMDWPATIGIDNLTLSPEPRGEVFLLGMLAFVAIAGTKLRRALAKS
jgi:hypothetical protein